VGEVVLMAGNSLGEGFTVGKAAEVERLTPAILVQIRGEVVVTKEVRVRTNSTKRNVLNSTYCLVRVAYSSLRAYHTPFVSYCGSPAACWASLSFFSMASIPARSLADLPCIALLKAESRTWSSRSRAIGAIGRVIFEG